MAYPILFHPDGVEIPNPTPGGNELPRGLGRRVLDLTQIQAVRVQWAHNLADALIELQLEYYDPVANVWTPLTGKTGIATAAYQNQTSTWAATPRFFGIPLTIRAVIFGPGSLSPKITYITIDGR